MELFDVKFERPRYCSTVEVFPRARESREKLASLKAG